MTHLKPHLCRMCPSLPLLSMVNIASLLPSRLLCLSLPRWQECWLPICSTNRQISTASFPWLGINLCLCLAQLLILAQFLGNLLFGCIKHAALSKLAGAELLKTGGVISGGIAREEEETVLWNWGEPGCCWPLLQKCFLWVSRISNATFKKLRDVCEINWKAVWYEYTGLHSNRSLWCALRKLLRVLVFEVV